MRVIAIVKAKNKIGNKKSTLNKLNNDECKSHVNNIDNVNINDINSPDYKNSILDFYTLDKNKINDSKLDNINYYVASNNKDSKDFNFSSTLPNSNLDNQKPKENIDIIASKNVTSNNLLKENRLNKLSNSGMDGKKRRNVLEKSKSKKTSTNNVGTVNNVAAKSNNNIYKTISSDIFNNPNYFDNKHNDYRDNQCDKDDDDSACTFYSPNQKNSHQNKLFSEQDNIMKNPISGSEDKETVSTQSFIATNETCSLSNSLNNGAVTQQNLDLSKDMFDMNASNSVVRIEEISEVIKTNTHNNASSASTEINHVSSSIKVEKMNDDTFLTTQIEIQTITEVTHFSNEFNQQIIEKTTERKGVRIRSKDTSLSSRYAKEYADMTEEFCCFNYTPPTKSISHFIFQNDLENLIRHIENQIGNEKFDLNQCDEIGETASWTPLYWAVKLNKIDFVKCLLEKGADVNVVINDYNECCGTALDLAMLRGYDSIELVLKEYMEKEAIKNQKGGFKNIRTKPRGKAPAFNFKYYGKKKRECQFGDDETINTQDFNLNK